MLKYNYEFHCYTTLKKKLKGQHSKKKKKNTSCISAGGGQ